MAFVKKIAAAALVMLISAFIFFLLVKEQSVKDDMLKAALQILRNDLLAMVPDGPQKRAVAEKIDAFIEQAEANRLPEEEIQRTVASALNLSRSPEPPTEEELEKIFEPTSAPFPPPAAGPADRRKLAHEINMMIRLRRELEQAEKEMADDSLRLMISSSVFFAADSGLKLFIPTELHHRGHLPEEWRQRLQQLERERVLVPYDYRHLRPVPRDSLRRPGPPPYPLPNREAMLRMRLAADSMKAVWSRMPHEERFYFMRRLPPIVIDPDSLQALIERIKREAAEETEVPR